MNLKQVKLNTDVFVVLAMLHWTGTELEIHSESDPDDFLDDFPDGFLTLNRNQDPTKNSAGKCFDEIDCFPGNTFCAENGLPDAHCIEVVGNPAKCSEKEDPHGVCLGAAPCGVHGVCSVDHTTLGRICTCHSGYEYKKVNNSGAFKCQDIDECDFTEIGGDTLCSVYDTCVNTEGSYKCVTSPDPFGVCVGINSPCFGKKWATCAVSDDKTTGECSCVVGFVWSRGADGDFSCVDLNECETDTHACLLSQFCANTEGGYFCAEHDGPCAAGAHTCDDMARCRPSYAKRGYNCECLPGFFGQGESGDMDGLIFYGPKGPQGCLDVDECHDRLHNCHPFEQCTNTFGSYSCTLEYDPFKVCDAGAHDCHALAACTPLFNEDNNDYKCTCRSGYQGDGRSCVDTDECRLGNHYCSSYQFCMNTEGGHSCLGSFDPLMSDCATGDHNCDLSLEVCLPNHRISQGSVLEIPPESHPEIYPESHPE